MQLPGAREEHFIAFVADDNNAGRGWRLGHGNESVDWLVQHVGCVDALPPAEEGRAESALLCDLTSVGILDGAAANKLGALHREALKQERHAHLDKIDAFDLLRRDGGVASSGGVR